MSNGNGNGTDKGPIAKFIGPAPATQKNSFAVDDVSRAIALGGVFSFLMAILQAISTNISSLGLTPATQATIAAALTAIITVIDLIRRFTQGPTPLPPAPSPGYQYHR